MKFTHSWLSFTVVLSVVFLSLVTAVQAETGLKALKDYPEGCGLYVYPSSTKSQAIDSDKPIAYRALTVGDTDPLLINLGTGQEPLPFLSKSQEDPEKIGDSVSLVFGKDDVRLKLDLKVVGFCEGKTTVDEGCEVQNLSGDMVLSTKDGNSSYRVKAENGC